MSDFLALRISSPQEQDVTGIFFPTAITGMDTFVPNKGLVLFQREEAEAYNYSSAESVLIGPEVRFYTDAVSSLKTQLYVATTRLEIFQALLPSAYQIQFEDEEYSRSIANILNEPTAFLELPEVILAPVGLNREKIIKLCGSIPELQNYVKRHRTIQFAWGEKKVQLVIKEEEEGLNSELIALGEKYYIPSPQRVRFFMKTKNSEEEISDAEYLIATDNPLALTKIFSGLILEEVEDFRILEELREAGIPPTATVYKVSGEGMKLDAGFITQSAYKKDVSDDFTKSIEESLKDF